MFKRVERKRKKREEEEELGLDEDTREIMGLNDTDSDESDSSSASEQDLGDGAQNDTDSANEVEDGEDMDQEDEAASEDEEIDEEPPITVAEASKDPLYLISLDPTIHGCILCKGKLIKSAGMAASHKNANAHNRRLEHFKKLAADADADSNAWELVRAIRSASNVHKSEPQALSKRALKRQAKQASIREKRKRHQELKVKAIAKKAANKLLKVDGTNRSASPENSPIPSAPQVHPQNPRKKQKLHRKTSTSPIMPAQELKTKLTKASTDGKPARKSHKPPHTKRAGKADKQSAS